MPASSPSSSRGRSAWHGRTARPEPEHPAGGAPPRVANAPSDARESRTLNGAGGEAFPMGGYYTLRGETTHALIRCGTYRHRPMQADMLHLDVWYHGHNI